jgi:hypothetical protein
MAKRNPTFELTHGQRVAAAKTYYAGALAYLDTFSGLVPVKVVRVITGGYGWVQAGSPEREGHLEVKVTAPRGPYKKGELVKTKAGNVVPRKHVRARKYGSRILSNYIWATGRGNPKGPKPNFLLGARAETEVFEEEEIAGYRIEEIRSCKPSKFRVTWEDEDGDERQKTFKTKGKALIWVGKQVKRRPEGAPKRERGRRRPAENPSRLRALTKLTRV